MKSSCCREQGCLWAGEARAGATIPPRNGGCYHRSSYQLDGPERTYRDDELDACCHRKYDQGIQVVIKFMPYGAVEALS